MRRQQPRPRGSARAARAVLCALALAVCGEAFAEPPRRPDQPPAAAPEVAPSPTLAPGRTVAGDDRRAALRTELDAVIRDIALGKERQAEIRAEIDGLTRDGARLGEQIVAAAARLQAAEQRLAVTERRIGDLDRDVGRARTALEARRDVLADVLAALQRIGRKPPPAIVVRPEDALGAVRSAILVGALLPELRDSAEALLVDLQSLEALKTAAAGERDRFRGEANDLVAERERLALLLEERRRTRGQREAGLEEERRRTAALAEKAGSLRDLIATLEAGAALRPPVDAPRLQPGLSFADARGRLALPVAGDTVLRWGDKDGTGMLARGLSIAARPEAAVTSPCDGTVIYAGPFRSYGKLLIINGGGGYHVVLAGLDRIDVEHGQAVLAGEPVGVMGGRGGSSARPDEAPARPILYVEFRKDGTSIDPSPWWAAGRDEKVRG